MISQTELWALLNYDPESGRFTWRQKTSKKIVVGSPAGTINGQGYVQIRIHGKIYAAHRLAFLWMTGSFPSKYIDHKNHDKTDNRWCNLREATPQENMRNRALPAGVQKRGNGYRARITVSGKEICLGSYASQLEAKAARLQAEKVLFNDFAPFNQVGI